MWRDVKGHNCEGQGAVAEVGVGEDWRSDEVLELQRPKSGVVASSNLQIDPNTATGPGPFTSCTGGPQAFPMVFSLPFCYPCWISPCCQNEYLPLTCLRIPNTGSYDNFSDNFLESLDWSKQTNVPRKPVSVMVKRPWFLKETFSETNPMIMSSQDSYTPSY